MCYILQAGTQCKSVTILTVHSILQVVSNKTTGIDVDKWDYILRDGHNLGIKVLYCILFTSCTL